VKRPFTSGSFGLFLGESAANFNGASRFTTPAHRHNRLDHFLPLLSTSYA